MGNIFQFSQKTLKPISPGINDNSRQNLYLEEWGSQKSQSFKMKNDECDLSIEERLEMTNYELFIRKVRHKKNQEYHSSWVFLSMDKKPKEGSFDPSDINFPILHSPLKKLINLSSSMIQEVKLAPNVLTSNQITTLITKVALSYNIVSYHNFSHAFSLMQFIYNCFKADQKFKSLYTDEEIFFTYFAGLAHDINHNGTNNGYEVKLNSQLAKLADNEAVLEKMHLRVFFEILDKNPSENILQKTKNKAKMKQLVARTILATDISLHFSNLKILKQKRQNGFNFDEDDSRYFILEQVFHACDISNPCLQFSNYMNWAVLLSYEFKEQTKLEQKNGLEVTNILRDGGRNGFLKGQIGFINALLFPLWKELSLTWIGFSDYVKNIEQNVKALKEKEEKQE